MSINLTRKMAEAVLNAKNPIGKDAIGARTGFSACHSQGTATRGPGFPLYELLARDARRGWSALGRLGVLALNAIRGVMLAAAVAFFPATAAHAQFTYVTNGGTITITGYTGPGGNVTIPPAINGLPVTSVGDCAFYEHSGLTGVAISGSVTNIGYQAFSGCYNLISVTFSHGLTTIGVVAFAGSALTSVRIPGSVTTIGAAAFTGCASLTNAIIPDSVTSLGGALFYQCSSLISATIPANIKSIPNSMFQGCTSLTSITIPNGVTNIEGSAFYSCNMLPRITIPNGVTSIEGAAFFDCASLTNVTIPGSVTIIADMAFARCISLPTISVDAVNVSYCSVDGVLFNKSLTTLAAYPAGKSGDYTIPKGVASIASHAFEGSLGMAHVSIPTSVTNIGDYGFCYCTNLTGITIPGSVNRIGGAAFLWCPSLTTVTIAHGVTSIGSIAFRECINLMSIAIPNSVTTIEAGAFLYCSELTIATIPASVTNIDHEAFKGCGSLIAAYFQGDAPTFGPDVFEGADQVTVYYSQGTTGWGPTFAGRPTLPWQPLMIVRQPLSRTNNAGTVATFWADAGGTAPFSFQWRRSETNLVNGGSVSGATTLVLTLSNVFRADAGEYCAVITNASGSLTSAVATLTVVDPWISSHPQPDAQTCTPAQTVRLSVTAAGTPPLNCQWWKDDIALSDGGNVSGARTPILTLNNLQTGDDGVYAVTVSNEFGVVTSTSATLWVDATRLAEALDAPSLGWITGGNAPWNGLSTVRRDGVDAAQSGPIGDEAESWVETHVTGPGTLTFWWRVSSEVDYDFLEFYLDEVLQSGRISGSTTWIGRTNSIPAGNHRLLWRYVKDEYVAEGQDRGWLDMVEYVSANPPPAILVSDASFGVRTNRFGFSLSGIEGQTVVIEASTNLVSWFALATNTFGLGSLYFSDPEPATFQQRFYRARVQ